LIKKVRELLAKHKGEKGIIHTVNYNIAEILVEQLDETVEGKRLLMPTAKNKKEVLEKFYKSSKDYVLISPSLTEGLDLKEDLSRFCIICKVPYMNITDTWIKERIRYDQNWYNCNVAQTLIQMTGRSIRSETDFATSYILDEAFYTFASKNYNLFPKWWQESVKEP
jgi:Rad3-related DNA helicase